MFIVLYPNDSNNKLYCVNSGDYKYLLYSNYSSLQLIYPHNPERLSKSKRILKMRISLIKNNIYDNINNDDI